MPRGQLLPALVDGKIDLAAAQLTVRPVLQKFVDFSNPTRTNVSEIVVWFGNVEVIAAERIGRETVTYVANIYKYYVAYKLVVEASERKAAAKSGGPSGQA